MVSEELTRELAPATFGWYRLSWQQFLEKVISAHCLPQHLTAVTRLGRWALLQQTLGATTTRVNMGTSRISGLCHLP